MLKISSCLPTIRRLSLASQLGTFCTFSAVALSALLVRNADAQTPAYSFYGVSGGDASVTLYQYNFTQANAYVSRDIVADLGRNYVNGLAWDAARENIYFRSGTNTGSTGSGGQNFFAYNRDTQLQTQINFGSGINLITNNVRFANASYYDGSYWSIGSGTDDLYRVTFDFTNANAPTYNAQIWLTNVNSGSGRGTGQEALDFGDIAIDTSNGTLYAFAFDQADNQRQFFRGTIPTIAGTTLTNSINIDRANDSLIQLALARRTDGTVGGAMFGATLAPGQISSVDLDTGVATVIPGAPNDGITDITSGAAYQPVPAPPAAISLGIGGLVGLIGTGVGKFRARRRKQAAKKA